MELTWHERYLILALRIAFPFFRKEGFGLCSMEYGFRDGDYLVFKSALGNFRISIIYNPGFDIVIHKNRLFGQYENISLVLEKRKYQKYIHLPEADAINTEYDLSHAIEGYLGFLKEHYFK